MKTQTILSLKNINHIYPGPVPVVAIKNISFDLKLGSFGALVGQSGSGKTTLLNLASGLDRPTSGKIQIGDSIISSLSQTELCKFRRNNIGFIFQSYNLIPILTVVENVEYTAIIRGDSPKQARLDALDSLERVGLEHKANFFPSQLSGGQQQRVAVARSLACKPKIIFADEPTANLDSKTAIDLINLFEELNNKLGLTFLFSTHDARVVERVNAKFVMLDGEIVTS